MNMSLSRTTFRDICHTDNTGTLLEMVMEILTLMGNLPRTGCVIVSKTWKKKFRKSTGIFIINATEILPYFK
jgi:hypothetical protein